MLFVSCSILFFIISMIQSQTISIGFPTFTADTDVGICTCDLTNQCDALCCCDPQCTDGDKITFACSSQQNQFTNSSPIYSSIQSNCFKNLSIFQSDTPYIVQKLGELVCLDFPRSNSSQFYPQPQTNSLTVNYFLSWINQMDYLIASPSIPTTAYSVGTPIIAQIATNTTPLFFSLPIALFGSSLCSGSKIITYMNDFTSTCSQLVTSSTCTNQLSPTTYTSLLSLIQSPVDVTKFTTTASSLVASNVSGTTCNGPLSTLKIQIFYNNPNGIQNVTIDTTVTATAATVTTGQAFVQTFIVQFIQAQSSSSRGNPGFLQGSNIVAGVVSNAQITLDITNGFSAVVPSFNGFCDVTAANRLPIRFGQSIRSNCQYIVTDVNNCAAPTAQLLSPLYNSAGLFAAAYSNYDTSSVSTDWLPVFFCVSDGSVSSATACSSGNISVLTTSGCYQRLDIQIAYTNIGSVINPQSVLSAVIFNYQTVTVTATTTIFLGTSVTFTELSNPPVVEQGVIPPPNTRLPADFFYPFAASRATNMFSSSYFVLLILLLYSHL